MFEKSTYIFILFIQIWIFSTILIEGRIVDYDDYETFIPKDKRTELYLRKQNEKRGAEFFIRCVVGKRSPELIVQ